MFRAIGRLLHWIWSGLDGLRKVLHLLLLLALFGVLWGAFSRPIPLVPDKAASSILAARSSSSLPEIRSSGPSLKSSIRGPRRRCCATS